MSLSVLSATMWGSSAATKHSFLIHGLTPSSHTWHRVASLLATQGYFVTAPDLIGHASRASSDYRFSVVVQDLRPYFEARHYSLTIGPAHSCRVSTTLSLFPDLPTSHPTAILLVDPPMQQSPEKLDLLDEVFTDTSMHIKPAEEHALENPPWTREDTIYRELGTRRCSVEAVHGIFGKNRPWSLFHCLDAVPDKWKVTMVLADPAIYKTCDVKDFQSYPHVRVVVVPGAGHWVQCEFVTVEEALKRVAELNTA